MMKKRPSFTFTVVFSKDIIHYIPLDILTDPDGSIARPNRGFDPEGADRLQLIDAVMQLLDYEFATGEDLREMDYNPDYGSAEEAAETAAAELEYAAEAAAAAALAADEEAAAAAIAAEAVEGGEGDGDAQADFDFGGVGDEIDGTLGSIADEYEEEGNAAAREVLLEAEGESDADPDESTVLGYAQSLGLEVLRTMKRDLNSVVGLLPASVAKPIREVAAIVEDTAVRIVVPTLEQAERYTRGLRREAGKAAGRAAVRVRDDVYPMVARGVASAAGKARRCLVDAVRRRGGGGGGGEEKEEGGEDEGDRQEGGWN